MMNDEAASGINVLCQNCGEDSEVPVEMAPIGALWTCAECVRDTFHVVKKEGENFETP